MAVLMPQVYNALKHSLNFNRMHLYSLYQDIVIALSNKEACVNALILGTAPFNQDSMLKNLTTGFTCETST